MAANVDTREHADRARAPMALDRARRRKARDWRRKPGPLWGEPGGLGQARQARRPECGELGDEAWRKLVQKAAGLVGGGRAPRPASRAPQCLSGEVGTKARVPLQPRAAIRCL